MFTQLPNVMSVKIAPVGVVMGTIIIGEVRP